MWTRFDYTYLMSVTFSLSSRPMSNQPTNEYIITTNEYIITTNEYIITIASLP